MKVFPLFVCPLVFALFCSGLDITKNLKSIRTQVYDNYKRKGEIATQFLGLFDVVESKYKERNEDGTEANFAEDIRQNPEAVHDMIEGLPLAKVIGLHTKLNEAYNTWEKWLIDEFDPEPFMFKGVAPYLVSPIIGSLLSAYAMDPNSTVLLEKARTIAYNFKVNNWNISAPLTGLYPIDRTLDLGLVYLQYRYMASLEETSAEDVKTGNRWDLDVTRLRDLIMSNKNYLYLNKFDITDEDKFVARSEPLIFGLNHKISDWNIFSAEGLESLELFDYLQFLVKAWLQTQKTDHCLKNMIDNYVKLIEKKLVRTSPKTGLMYVVSQEGPEFEGKMSLRACNLGATLAHAGRLELAEKVARTCHQACRRSPTGLPTRVLHFDNETEAVISSKNDASNETIFTLGWDIPETYFVLWRETKNPMYRDWAWDYFVSIFIHSKDSNVYKSMADARSATPFKHSSQPATFLGRTLFYLYMTFEDEDILPSDKWVFGIDDKPTPILGPLLVKESQRLKISEDSPLLCEPTKTMSSKIADSNQRKAFIKGMFAFAWEHYERYAWGYESLNIRQKVGSGRFFVRGGSTIIESLPVLKAMGLEAEFEKARNWTLVNATDLLDFTVFKNIPELVGSLVSTYSMTKDKAFLDLALNYAEKMLPTFRPAYLLPCLDIRDSVKSNCEPNDPGYFPATIGNYFIEFEALGRLTDREDIVGHSEDLRGFLVQHKNMTDLRAFLLQKYPLVKDSFYMTYLQQSEPLFGVTPGYLELLLKIWLYSGKTDDQIKANFDYLVGIIEKNITMLSNASKLTYVPRALGDNYMQTDYCTLGGILAMGGHVPLAEKIARTCHEICLRTKTGLPPKLVYFINVTEAVNDGGDEKDYQLEWHVVQSYFYLFRVTKNKKYQDMAWAFALALEKHAKTENGYAGLKDVYAADGPREALQPPHFLGRTLFYLYLTFTNDTVLSLNNYIFNSAAKPIPFTEPLSNSVIGNINVSTYVAGFVILIGCMWVVFFVYKLRAGVKK